MSLASDFKAFILRGSVVDLAVGVVIGAAFTGVVTAFTKDILTPLIGIPGKLSAGDVIFTVNGSKFLIGDFINAIISFLMIAIVVFFFVVRPVNWLMSRKKTEVPVDPTTRECPYCLSSIPVNATRCAFCTSEVTPAQA
ncbi:MAG TPA: large conductance mechanosensitive channel protein MscL [Chthonomonadaceae bacterium]|nr:large conductance mechanosensitive channel protein MscL [Chthonomonadaceae bacterium]